MKGETKFKWEGFAIVSLILGMLMATAVTVIIIPSFFLLTLGGVGLAVVFQAALARGLSPANNVIKRHATLFRTTAVAVFFVSVISGVLTAILVGHGLLKRRSVGGASVIFVVYAFFSPFLYAYLTPPSKNMKRALIVAIWVLGVLVTFSSCVASLPEI